MFNFIMSTNEWGCGAILQDGQKLLFAQLLLPSNCNNFKWPTNNFFHCTKSYCHELSSNIEICAIVFHHSHFKWETNMHFRISHIQLGYWSYEISFTFLKKALRLPISGNNMRLKKIKLNQIQRNTNDYSRFKKSSIYISSIQTNIRIQFRIILTLILAQFLNICVVLLSNIYKIVEPCKDIVMRLQRCDASSQIFFNVKIS
jgi:hypothetical protein